MIRGTGIELVEISPFEGLLEADRREELEARFTGRELEYCLPKKRAGEHLAARFAAKVATLKALGLDSDKDRLLRAVEVVRAPSGQPGLELAEPVRSLADRAGLRKLHLSISHSGGYAVGMVIAEVEEGLPERPHDEPASLPLSEEKAR